MRVRNPMPMLDIHTTNAVIQIKSQRLKMQVNRQPARMRVTRTPPSFKVNWSQNLPAGGRVDGEHATPYSQELQFEGVQQVNFNSNSLAPHQENGAREPELVSNTLHRRHRTRNSVNLNVSTAPKSVGNISWEPGSMEIEWDPHRLEMSWEGSARPEITVTPHSVEIRLINGETVRVGENEAKAIEMQGFGKRVDKEI